MNPGYSSPLSVNWQSPVRWEHGLNKGLVSWWLVNPYARFGSVWRDLCNIGHGDLTNMAPASDWVNNNRRGSWGALDFDGTNDVVLAPARGFYDNLPAISAAMWVFCPTTATQRLLSKRSNGVAGWWDFLLASNAPQFVIDYDGADLNRVATNTIATNTWTHVAFSWTGSATATNIHIYLNAVEVAYTTTTNGTTNRVSDATPRIAIGNWASADRTFLGQIDDVRLYSRAIGPEEVARLYVESQTFYPSLLRRWENLVGGGGNRNRRALIAMAA